MPPTGKLSDVEIQDIEAWIKRNLGASLGCWTNFGVFDASG